MVPLSSSHCEEYLGTKYEHIRGVFGVIQRCIQLRQHQHSTMSQNTTSSLIEPGQGRKLWLERGTTQANKFQPGSERIIDFDGIPNWFRKHAQTHGAESQGVKISQI